VIESKLTKELLNKYFGDWPYSQDLTSHDSWFTIIVIYLNPNKYSIYIDEYEGENGIEVIATVFCDGKQILGYIDSDIIDVLDAIKILIQS
jgi:hypothetical protein